MMLNLLKLLSCSTNIKSFAGPKNWSDAEKYIPIQQKQFCDLKNRFLSNLYNANFSRNKIKINRFKKLLSFVDFDNKDDILILFLFMNHISLKPDKSEPLHNEINYKDFHCFFTPLS